MTGQPTPELAQGTESPFYVPAMLDLVGNVVHRFRRFFLWLADLESSQLADELSRQKITKPIFICGLARSGSTLLHEVVCSCAGVATHRMRDYPMVFTPYWWRQATAHNRPTAARERPHRDRMMITSESPDAIEEMLWMAFFPTCHDPALSAVLSSDDRHPAFETFYRNHLRKLLLSERAQRYAAKANYHVARLGYLLRLFPDAKFIIPIRAPASHIASLRRQHERFSQGQRGHPRALAFMRRSGHFEFGCDRRPMNLGDSALVRKIQDAWSGGQEIRGWALSWAMTYAWLAEVMRTNAGIRAAAHVVRFEDLCSAPESVLGSVLNHCALAEGPTVAARFAATISAPAYYDTTFSAAELDLIHGETAETARAWGY